MEEVEKELREIDINGNFKLKETEFFKVLSNAISMNNMQSIYMLSKAFTRYFVKKLNN